MAGAGVATGFVAPRCCWSHVPPAPASAGSCPGGCGVSCWSGTHVGCGTISLSLSEPLLGAFCPQLLSQPGLPPPPRTHLCPHLPIHNLSSPLQAPSFPWGGRRCPEQINPYPEAPLHFWPLWQEHSSGAVGQRCPWCEQTSPPDAGAWLCATGTRRLLPPCSSSQGSCLWKQKCFSSGSFLAAGSCLTSPKASS